MISHGPRGRSAAFFAAAILISPLLLADDPFTGPDARRHPPTERSVDVQHMKIHLRLDHGEKRVRGKVEITLRALSDSLGEFSLDCAELNVKKVTQPDGRPYSFHQSRDKLVILCDPPLSRQTPVTLAIDYQGTPRRGLYFVGPDEGYPSKPVQVFSQGEPEETRYWIPCHDYPNDRLTSEMIVTVRRPYIAISNGKLVSVTEESGGSDRTFRWKEDVPHVSYLISLVVGEYAETKEEVEGVRLLYYVPKKDKDLVPNSFSKTPEILKFFSRQIGVPYPYEKYAQVTVHDFMWGGMENISATTLTQRTLHRKRSQPIASSEGLVAHELAHQWWGDLLTCRSWSEIWLNEGFATYFTTLWFEEARGRDELRHRVRGHQKAILGEDSSRYRRPLVQEVFTDPINLFDAHSYQKGAAVLHMLRFVLGDEGFWEGIRQYAQKYRAGLVETADLRKTMEEATGKDLTVFFRQWVHLAGHPKFRVSWDWDPETSMVELTVSQVQPADGTTPIFETPVAIELTTGKEKQSYRIRVRGREQIYYLPAPARPEMVRFDKGGWLLKEMEFEKGKEEVLLQLSMDDDVTGRYLAIELLQEMEPFDEGYRALGKAVVTDAFWGVRAEAARALGVWGEKKAVEHLSRAVQDDDARVRQAAVAALGRLRDDHSLSLVRSVYGGDVNDYVEAAAALALGEYRGRGVEDELLRGLDRSSHQEVIRSNVIRALGKLGGEKALSTLLLEVEYGKPPPSRVAAIGALKEFARKDESVRDRLRDLLRDRHIWARGAAADVLADVGGAKILPDLEDLAQRETDGRVRERARKAIRKIQGREPLGREREREQMRRIQGEREELRGRVRELETELAKYRKKERELESELRDQEKRIRALEEAPAGAGKE